MAMRERRFSQGVERNFSIKRHKPAHVLLSIEEYRRLIGGVRKIADALAMPGGEDIEFDPPRINIGLRPADFS